MSSPQLVHDSRSATVVKRDRLVRIGEVLRLVGVGKSTWYALMAAGDAPRSVQLTPRCVAWSENAVLAFVLSRLQPPVADEAGQ